MADSDDRRPVEPEAASIEALFGWEDTEQTEHITGGRDET